MSKTAAAFTTSTGFVYQRDCLSICTQTGTFINGQIQGIFCCTTDLCNNITNSIATSTSTIPSTALTTTITTTSTALQCYNSNITVTGLGNPITCQSNEKFCYVIYLLS